MKILLLGSGALQIGQAGEFDYSGSQAIKAFKNAGHEVILINPNIATVQTDSEIAGSNLASNSESRPGDQSEKSEENSPRLADKIYYLPVIPEFVERICKKEKPDAIALSFGGQTGLNCGLELEESGFLKKNNIKVLGTSVDAIRNTEDREIFANKCRSVGVKTPNSIAARSVDEANAAAKVIGFPMIMRAGFALGGKGSGFCEKPEDFPKMVRDAFAFSPQLLIEEDLRGWKEIEYEVVRDSADNCITVVNMENFDPLGIHTGESIVISPSQTLANEEYQILRDVALKMTRELGIVGECNIQYALDPKNPQEYRVIEMNPRLSRSSALASKATGYPLAAVAADILIGKNLPEIKNAVTQKTSAFFEPALDYVALKIPRWDLQKFRKVSHQIATEMKSVGEVMALGRNFPEVLQKAVRMLAIGSEGVLDSPIKFKNKADIEENIRIASPRRIFALAEGLFQKHFTENEIWEMTKIDPWFLGQIKRITDGADEIQSAGKNISSELLEKSKILGFSDSEIARLTDSDFKIIRKMRIDAGILPVNKQIDTLAAEFPAATNYLYTTYLGNKNDA